MTDNIELVIDDINIIVKKKKGRPRKNPIELPGDLPIVPLEKKKRGRKKKEKVEEEVKPKKKRGRKAALKFFSSTIRKKIPLTTIIYDNDKSILHLDIKEEEEYDNSLTNTITYGVLKREYNKENSILGTKLDDRNDPTDFTNDISNNIDTNILLTDGEDDNNILCEYLENNDNIDITELYEKRLQHRLNQDARLLKNLENLNDDDNLLCNLLNNVNHQVKDTISSDTSEHDNIRKLGIYNVLSPFVETDKWMEKTDVCCWWCCHKFDSIPIGRPTYYNTKIKKFRVTGVFCSFACMLAINDHNPLSRHMSLFLYKRLTGSYTFDFKDNYLDILHNDPKIQDLFKDDLQYKDEYIKSLVAFTGESLEKAPPRCLLKMFGGELNIEEFRNTSNERKIYRMIEYPMYVSRDYIEEVDIQVTKTVNKKLFDKQQHIQPTNTLDDKKLEEVKNRINASIIVTSNSIDKFITF